MALDQEGVEDYGKEKNWMSRCFPSMKRGTGRWSWAQRSSEEHWSLEEGEEACQRHCRLDSKEEPLNRSC